MKKEGMTIIESVVTIALLGIVFLLVTPLIRGFGKVNTRVKTQKEIDREFANINEFIQKKIRSARETTLLVDGIKNTSGSYIAVYPSFDQASFDFTGSTSQDGSVLFLETPYLFKDEVAGIEETRTKFSFFIFEENKLKYREGISGSNETLMEEVDKASFRFQEGIVLYYIDLDIGEYEGKLRSSFKGSASTRIDID